MSKDVARATAVVDQRRAELRAGLDALGVEDMLRLHLLLSRVVGLVPEDLAQLRAAPDGVLAVVAELARQYLAEHALQRCGVEI